MKIIINFIKTRYLFGMIRLHKHYANKLSYHVDEMKKYRKSDPKRFVRHARKACELIPKCNRLDIKINSLGNQLKSEMGIE